MTEPISETDAAEGVPAVEEAREGLEGLAERPVEEHVAVFERAHEQLRRALDASS